MPALVAGIHVFRAKPIKDVDGRNKSGHDGHEQQIRAGGFTANCEPGKARRPRIAPLKT
jgi:hypothetical protein